MSDAEKYAHWVLAPENEKRNGRLIKLAAKRFLFDLQRKDIYFDEKQARLMPGFCREVLVQWEGEWEGQPFEFELWQKFIFEQIYGWFYTDTKLRRFDEVCVLIAKKNGKSSMAAGLMNYHVNGDARIKTPKCFTAANNEEQAKICVNMAGKIIEASPILASMVEKRKIKLMHYGENIISVVNVGNNGLIKALSKETGDKTSKTAGGKHGINASLGVVDEIGMAPDYGNAKTIKTSMASRKEGLMFYISTAGYNMDGPCYKELRKVGIDVLEGTIKKDNYLPIIYEIDPPIGNDGKPGQITIQWLLENEDVWEQANPNIDVSVQRKFLRNSLEDAATFGGTTEVDVKTLNFNMWVESPEVFIPAEIWNKNTHGITHDALVGQECYGGLEIVGGDYLNSFAMVFHDINGKTVVKCLFWMPESFKKGNDSAPWNEWVSDGLITEYLGNVSDNDLVIEMILSELEKYQIHSFAFKKNLVSNDIVQGLIKNGIEGVKISHGYNDISTPTIEWESLLRGFHVEHFGNPVLNWMNSNCTAKRRDNEVRLEKLGSRVVGIYAAISAIHRWKTNEAEGVTPQVGFFEL